MLRGPPVAHFTGSPSRQQHKSCRPRLLISDLGGYVLHAEAWQHELAATPLLYQVDEGAPQFTLLENLRRGVRRRSARFGVAHFDLVSKPAPKK
jgi:hypothetical protein